MGDTRTRKYEFLIVLDIKQNNNEQIVFDMFEEVATESIAEARNVFTYEEIEGLRWSRDSGSALYDTLQTAVLGRAGSGK